MRISLTQPPLGTPINARHPLSQDLLACYLMNEGGGLKSINKAGAQSVNGTLTGAAVYKKMQRGNCVSLDGTTGYIDCTGNTYLSPTSITVSCWVNFNTIPALGAIIKRGPQPTSTYAIYVNTSGKLQLNVTNTALAELGYTGVYTLSINTWYHIVLTYNSSVGLTGYVNGRLDATTAANGNIAVDSTTTAIGTDLLNAGRFINAYVQNVMIWKRALPATQVKQLYTNPYCMYQQKRKKL